LPLHRPLDARIDLHGRTQSEAHAALPAFCATAQATARASSCDHRQGARTRDDWSDRGVLKRQVPQWLGAGIRSYVVGFEDAHLAMAARAAYVRLRRARGRLD